MYSSITRPPLLRRLSLRLGPHSSSPACGAWQRARSVGRPPPRCGSTAALSLGAAAVLARAGRARGWKQRMASAGAEDAEDAMRWGAWEAWTFGGPRIRHFWSEHLVPSKTPTVVEGEDAGRKIILE